MVPDGNTVSRTATTARSAHASSTSQKASGVASPSAPSRWITLGCYWKFRPPEQGPRVNCGYGRMGHLEPARPAPTPGRRGTAAAFRDLCRSSPWKWHSLRFEYLDRPLAAEPGSPGAAPHADLVRAWLRRPGALRLETADGLVLQSTTGINDSRDVFYTRSTRKTWLLPPHLVTPVYDDHGLVRRRPEAAYGEPGFGNGRFAAALDPVELAGNAPVPLEFPNANPVELGTITGVVHEGRPRPGSHRDTEPRIPPQRPRRAAVPAGPHAREDRRRHGRMCREPVAGRRAER